jgi:DNA replication and repair protein RecF
VQIGWIQLAEFRNYRTLEYSPSPHLNLLIGSNAQGKTNLLEALGFLLTGRSFRTSRLTEVPRWEASSATVSGELRRAEGGRTVRRMITKHENGAAQVSGDACEWARVIAFGWQDLDIVNGAPGARRTFIDGFAARLYPGHLATLLRYRQILARRNHLLSSREPDIDARLEPWDEQLATTGMELIDRRRKAAAMLQTELGRVFPALSGMRQKIEIRYRTALGEATEAGEMLAEIARVRRDELRRGITLVGPHRDDLAIELDGVDVRAFGSRGQQRLIALALRLAEVLPVRDAVGTTPVLLLDDALSELDPRVRENVLREIRGAEQVFLTSPDALPEDGAACWTVRAGAILGSGEESVAQA